HRLFEGVEDGRRRVSEHERPPREDVVDVLMAVHVPDARAGAAVDHERLAADAAKRAHRRAHAAGKQRAGALHHLVRAAGHRPKLPTDPSTVSTRARRGAAPDAETTRTSEAPKSTSSITSSSRTSTNVPG